MSDKFQTREMLLHQPVLRWAGGKTKLMPEIRRHFPVDPTKRWIEPFIGSGAVFLNVFSENALLADNNPDLISFFEAVQKNPGELLRQIQVLAQHKYDRQRYYQLREEFNQCYEPFRRGVLFFAINNLCFNGLCRYNLKREFNGTWGKRPVLKVDEGRIRYLSFRLSGIELRTAGFEETLSKAGAGDQIYCDPPYDKLNDQSFTKYDGNSFGMEEQIKLADLLAAARDRGAIVAISNSVTEFTHKLYQDRGFTLHILNAVRSIGAAANTRKSVKELLAVSIPLN